MDLDELRPDADRLWNGIEELSGFTEPDHDGWTRRVLGEPYLESRGWVAAQMAGAGLQVHTDAAGNTIGVLAGTEGKASIGTGSHTDTVARGGRFDGIVGTLGAIEVALRLRETGTRLRDDLVVIDFLGEEPNEFGTSCIGSRALTGAVSPDFFDRTNDDGRTLGDRLQVAGFPPDGMLGLRWPAAPLRGFVELHIEQGPVLERTGTELGVVTAIAGIERVVASFLGRADHAGTAAMTDRKDALAAAAQAILTVEQIGCSGENSVATVGTVHVEPGALNVVPSLARLWAEMRSPSPDWLGTARRELMDRFAAIAAERGIEVDLRRLTDQDPVPTAHSVQDLIADTSDDLGYSWRSIPSGAGHDAAHLAAIAPAGMIFVPSRAGRSHCPEEWTDREDIARGAHALAATLVRMDGLALERDPR
ncbi:M20 family metallo-hydrolase [Microlunatus sp. GCM10028923]|uniref:M20 family metallo-hydrolase n=1 Tax=Microlunatus sp. GCM10028923 TaxID=3273400 RepID=UPI00361893EE